MEPACFICGGTTFEHVTRDYRRCGTCGHETLATSDGQTFMLNDTMRAADLERRSSLDRFQAAVLDRFSAGRPRGRWLDIGSASGKFLRHNHGKFASAGGLEITPAAVTFSRALGLDVATSIDDVPAPTDFATAWHSLEHFPSPALGALLLALRATMPAGARVIVSVPNGASWQYHVYRRRFAFFDVPNHLQQFTPDSLARLFAAQGFRQIASVTSWPYNAFGHVQALLNLAVPEPNYLYYRLKRGRRARSWLSPALSAVLLPLALPAGVVLGALDAVFPARQGVLTWCFEREG